MYNRLPDNNIVVEKNNPSNLLNLKHIGTIVLIFFIAICFSTNLFTQTIEQPISDISTTIKKYTYTYLMSSTEKKDIRYIIVKASNGDIKTSFDACDVCYKDNKGYSQKNNQIICNKCGNTFNIDTIGIKVTGSCFPGYLPHTLGTDSVIFKVSDITSGAYLFPAQPISDVYENTNNDNTSKLVLFNTNNDLNIKMPSLAQRIFLIISLNGQICKVVSSANNELSIDICDLSSGIYILSVEESGKIMNKTFCISK